MSLDQRAYQRAASAALVGLFAQLLLAVVIGLAGLYAQSAAIHAATWHAIGGIPIWFVLWALFQAHGQERREALEAEQLAADDAQAAALFDEAGQNLRLAKRRLDSLTTWGLGATSAVTAAFLLVMGLTLALVNFGLIAREPGEPIDPTPLLNAAISEQARVSLLAGLFIGAGLVIFLVARYVAGMTVEKAWLPLRGGAGYLLGDVVAMALLAAACLIQSWQGGDRTAFAALSIAIPVLMALQGLEILLSFVFGLYRPRKADEAIRPAFDSRVLGWLTRPESLGKIVGETLNYQFGFEVSRSWFFSLLARLVSPLCIVAIAVFLLLSCLVLVQPQQRAIITLNGAIVGEPVGPGLHFKAPWPFGGVDRVNAARVEQLTVGSLVGASDGENALLWSSVTDDTGETFFVSAPTPLPDVDELGNADSAAGELVSITMTLGYRVKQPTDPGGDGVIAYATSSANPGKLLGYLASQQLNNFTAGREINDLLADPAGDAADTLRTAIQQAADDYGVRRGGMGIEIVDASITAVRPPTNEEVANAFMSQLSVRQEVAATLETARKDAIATLAEVAGSRDRALTIASAISELERMRQADEPTEAVAAQEAQIEGLLESAGGEAARILQEARAYRWQQGLSEQARADSFAAQRAAYEAAPSVYRARVLLEAVAQSLANTRKIVVDSADPAADTMRLDLNDTTGSFQGIFSE
ncbi:MAG: SPFH domain-containing protein [Planctomycetota bacterium]